MFITGNFYLNEEQKKINASYIWNVMGAQGWTINSVSAMLGNMEVESSINPGIWEGLDEGDLLHGFGLVQWTPATKYLNWCVELDIVPASMDSAIARINWELENGEQFYSTPSYPMNFRTFKESTLSVEYLSDVFVYNYERAGDPDVALRRANAVKWYEYLSGTPYQFKKKGMPLWMKVLIARRVRNAI